MKILLSYCVHFKFLTFFNDRVYCRKKLTFFSILIGQKIK